MLRVFSQIQVLQTEFKWFTCRPNSNDSHADQCEIIVVDAVKLPVGGYAPYGFGTHALVP